MAFKIGSSAVSAVKLGSLTVNKIMLGITLMYSAGVAAFDPTSLFTAQTGAFYDPSDLTDTKLQWCIDNPAYTNASFLAQFPNHALFQDSAGTTAVTAVEQPLGKVLDKSGKGNHRTQATSGFKPKWSARKNLLLATATMSTQNITSVATPYTISHTGTGTITLSGTSTAGPLVGAGSLTFTPTAGTLTMTVSGTVSNAQLEYGSTATTYQSVVTATNYNALTFPKYTYSDGVDDASLATSGGGSTTAFCFMTAFQCLKVGARQTLFSDVGTNTGYKVEINATDQLVVSAGNGTTYVSATTVNKVKLGGIYTVECYHDGTNLVAILDEQTPASVAFTVATAGTAGFTLYKDNGAASGFLKANTFGQVYGKNTCWDATKRVNAIAYLRTKAGIVRSSWYPYPAFGGIVDSTAQNGFTTDAYLTLYSNGTLAFSLIEEGVGSTFFGTAWSTGTNPGASHWVRVTEVSIANGPTVVGITAGTWVPLSSTQFTGISKYVGGGNRAITIEIATDANGYNIVSTRSVQFFVTHYAA